MLAWDMSSTAAWTCISTASVLKIKHQNFTRLILKIKHKSLMLPGAAVSSVTNPVLAPSAASAHIVTHKVSQFHTSSNQWLDTVMLAATCSSALLCCDCCMHSVTAVCVTAFSTLELTSSNKFKTCYASWGTFSWLLRFCELTVRDSRLHTCKYTAW